MATTSATNSLGLGPEKASLPGKRKHEGLPACLAGVTLTSLMALLKF